MRRITYYVAVSIDGFISGPSDDISGFVQGGNGVERYLNDLKNFDTVLMGRKTYEFGYKYGLTPGEPAYPHMMHYVFSKSLRFDQPHKKVNICDVDLDLVMDLKNQRGSDIYLCGGGELAGWLVDHEMVDVLKVKLNPFIQGEGTKLFGPSTKRLSLELTDQGQFDFGLQILTYDIKY